jgi:hypothetical protein
MLWVGLPSEMGFGMLTNLAFLVPGYWIFKMRPASNFLDHNLSLAAVK